MATSNKARSIIFIPGAWHKCSAYDPTLTLLKKADYPGKLITIELPSVDAAPDSPAIWSMVPDIQTIEAAIAAEIEAGNLVLVLAHSYGAIPASCAMKKFVDTGMVKFVVLAGFLLELGESLIALSGGVPPSLWKREGDYVWPSDGKVFYNDLPENIQQEFIAQIKSHSYATKISPATFEGWAAVPTTYIMCLKDMALLTAYQEFMVNRAKARGVNLNVISMNASHSPMISQPENLAKILTELAA